MKRFRDADLRTKMLLLQVSIVLLVVALTCGAFITILERVVEEQYGQRVLGVAQAVAQIPTVRDAFDDADPSATIQPLAEDIRESTGVAFVVVANREQIRYSHPNPERIGQLLSTDPQPALEGRPYVITERGTLGQSIRAKVPIYDSEGQIIGAVSVGILEDSVRDVLGSHWALIGLVGLLSVAVGAAGSYFLAGQVKRQIFGLEPVEIAKLLQHREALLYGIREGVLAVDRHGSVSVANAEARRLLDLPDDVEGRPILEVLPQSDLPEAVATGRPERDKLTLGHNGRAIVVNRMPVRLGGQVIGAVSTFRDQTEVQQLARELVGTRGHLEALRAQAHEFANKLHTIAGLVDLGWYDEVRTYISRVREQQQELVERLPQRIREPSLVALLVGKASVAAERGIDLRVSDECQLASVGQHADDLTTVVGNLVENAFDAVAGLPERRVEVLVRDEDQAVHVRVSDSGPGVPADLVGRIFEDGFSTKTSGTISRGVGLALVRRIVSDANGIVSVRPGPGAVFDVFLPRESAATPSTSTTVEGDAPLRAAS